MREYNDHDSVLQYLKDDQEAERDLREEYAGVIAFLHHPQGQWEPEIWADYEGRPRYTFDQCKPQINKAWAEMAANEYTATTQPVGGGASEDVSNIIDGLIRNIHNTSSSDDITTKSGKRMIAAGFGGWRVVAKYVGESFHQDLQVVPINNIHERVWFDCNAEMQTREDGQHVFVLQSLATVECEKRWPKRESDFESVSSDLSSHTYSHKPQKNVVVGELIYKEPITKTIYLLDDEEHSVVDAEGLVALGLTPESLTVVDSRECDSHKIMSRRFDGKGWLDKKAKETVFKHLPVIPEYANFDVVENKVTYEGLVRPIMDAARVFNYVESRKVEESILSPRQKIFLDERSAEGRTSELSRLNRSSQAVQLYRGTDAKGQPLPPPVMIGGVQPNPGLSELSQDMIRNVELTTGLPNELTVLQSTTRDSDARFNERTNQGTLGTFEFYRGHKVALEHTAKVLLGAIPKVYDSERMVRIVGEDGQSSEVLINQRAAGQIKNNLTLGNYDICVKVGPAFKDRQAEANTKIIEMAALVDGLADRNADVLLNNMDAPGMRTTADRERDRLFKAGLIPQDQMTDEELKIVEQQSQQEAPPDPNLLIAQAEMQRAQYETQQAQFRMQAEQVKLQQSQQKQDTDSMKMQMDMQLRAQKQQMDEQSQSIKNLTELIEGLKLYREAMGADAVVSEGAVEGYERQAELTQEGQSNL